MKTNNNNENVTVEVRRQRHTSIEFKVPHLRGKNNN